MKIALEPSIGLLPLRRHLELEGNQIVDTTEAEFLITNKPFKTTIPAMLSGEVFNSLAMAELEYKISDFPADFFISKWWDAKASWSPQTFLGIPAIGLMNGGLSAPVVVGCLGCYTSLRLAQEYFSKPPLSQMLSTLHHSGFVSLHISSEDGLVSGAETGVPAWGLYNVLEGIGGRIQDFLENPVGILLKESWTVSLLVSRFPYPSSLSSKEAGQITGITEDVEKHFWLGEHKYFGHSTYSSSTVVGIATAWGNTPWAANGRAVATCQNIQASGIQYRTDIDEAGELVYNRIESLL